MASWRALKPFVTAAVLVTAFLQAVHAAGSGQRRALLSTQAASRLYVVFGDSITDTGNTLKATNGTLPSPSVYWKGRFTNGRNWVDYLAFADNAWSSRRITVRNYATGAATACAPGPAYSIYSAIARDGANQTASYVADYKAGKIPKTTAQPLFIYWLGVNDLAEALYLNALTPPEAWVGAFVQRVTECRINAVRLLVEQGGAKAVAVMPLGAVQETTDVPAAMKPMVKSLVDALDQAASAALQQLQALYSSGVKLVYVGGSSDWYLEGMDSLGFKNRTAPCVDDPYALRPKEVQPKICARPNSYLFYSQLHPTTTYHKWVAQQGMLPKLLEEGLLQ